MLRGGGVGGECRRDVVDITNLVVMDSIRGEMCIQARGQPAQLLGQGKGAEGVALFRSTRSSPPCTAPYSTTDSSFFLSPTAHSTQLQLHPRNSKSSDLVFLPPSRTANPSHPVLDHAVPPKKNKDPGPAKVKQDLVSRRCSLCQLRPARESSNADVSFAPPPPFRLASHCDTDFWIEEQEQVEQGAAAGQDLADAGCHARQESNRQGQGQGEGSPRRSQGRRAEEEG